MTGKIKFIVKRGRNVGLALFPHFYEGGYYIVSISRFKKDYVRVSKTEDLIPFLEKGFKVRMSNTENGTKPSLIGLDSIEDVTK